ncbi:hypothetical protein M758_1G075100 [Ceratodon purpureus]|nr:hypothetical protein M758_1G075100 [Ceratodon purpureus]
MAMVMVHFTPTILANPLHCTLICTPRLKQQLAHNPFCSVFVKLAEFESRTRGKRIATWRVNAQAVNEELHSAEELRAQLEALRQEAERVRNRASSARMRFMRLTHVVEQLRQRAAVDVRMGKEDSARTLLSEKQKVMKALEAARQRAELLEQLAGKLNIAISIKETRLIATLSSAPLSIRPEPGADTGSVHHVSPRTTTTEGLNEGTSQSDGDDEDDMTFRDSQ